MSVLGYSALNKIKKTLDTTFGEADDVSIISKEVTIENSDIVGGDTKEINIGNLPENCVLIHSSLNLTTPFNINSGDVSPEFNLGVGTDENVASDFPTANDPASLIFKNLILDSVGSTDYQGDVSGTADKMLNEYPNSLVAKFRMRGIWSSAASLAQSRYISACFGEQTSAVIAGGYSNGYLGNSEVYDGVSWSYSGSLSAGKYYMASCGTQIAGLLFGGRSSTTNPLNVTEEWNVSSWSTGGNLNLARRGFGGAGSQTAGLSFGGYDNSVERAETEEYNGASWTTTNDLSVAIREMAGSGTQTAAISTGGSDGSARQTNSEEYNGTSWATANPSNVARNDCDGFGLQNTAVSFGGSGTSGWTKVTEEYNGISWYLGNDFNSETDYVRGAGTQSAGIRSSGYQGDSAGIGTTELYDSGSLAELTQGSLTLYVTYTHR